MIIDRSTRMVRTNLCATEGIMKAPTMVLTIASMTDDAIKRARSECANAWADPARIGNQRSLGLCSANAGG
ncbi:MAG: hypothetical protein ACXVP2_12400, partial [Tumebacillaceae bacterium]